MKTFFILLFFCGIIVHAHAQIVYTDVKPDIVFDTSGSVYYLDLNNDGINDFDITYKQEIITLTNCNNREVTNSYIRISSLNQNEIYEFSQNIVAVVDSNEIIYRKPIGSTVLWINGSDQILTDTGKGCYFSCGGGFCHGLPCCNAYWTIRTFSDGYWAGAVNKYIALRLCAGTNLYYYGWIRLNVSSNGNRFTVKDYAYSSIPNQPILAGEKRCTAPTVTLKANGSLNFCAGDSVILTATGTGYLYQWNKDAANILGATSNTYIAKTAGTYKCRVTNSCGSITSPGKIVTVTCLQSNLAVSDEKLISKATQLQITPNPFLNSTTISFLLPQSKRVTIQIFDATGRLIKVLADAQMQAGAHQLVWNIKDEKGNEVGAGIYFLKIETGTFSKTQKLIVVK